MDTMIGLNSRNKKGKDMEIYHVNDTRFIPYGKVLGAPDCSDMLTVMRQIPVPEKVVYVAAFSELEACDSLKKIRAGIFGGMEVQAGYCTGHNVYLDAVEYHKCSEVNVAVTDLIVFLGKKQDIVEDFIYPTEKIEAFFIPAGTVVEIYATTLHYAPCQNSEEGFSWIVILPKGSNTDIDPNDREDLEEIREARILFARNKWLIAHEEAGIEGAFAGLVGENLKAG